MTKPSRIVKSAWTKAGKPGSLKSFARTEYHGGEHWLANKRKQRKRRQSAGFTDVYLTSAIRSQSTSLAAAHVSMREEVK